MLSARGRNCEFAGNDRHDGTYSPRTRNARPYVLHVTVLLLL